MEIVTNQARMEAVVVDTAADISIIFNKTSQKVGQDRDFTGRVIIMNAAGEEHIFRETRGMDIKLGSARLRRSLRGNRLMSECSRAWTF